MCLFALDQSTSSSRGCTMLSTELDLLQSNMMYMYEKRGPQYHWVVELFECLKLPVFDGVEAALEAFKKQLMAVSGDVSISVENW